MFRLKIALLSVLLSGLVLVGLGLYSLSVMDKVSMDRIDQELLSLGEGHLAVGPPRGYWENFENSLRFIYGEGRTEHLIVQIKDPGNELLFKSAQWPPEITEDAFPPFDRTMDRQPPDPAADTRENAAPAPPHASEQRPPDQRDDSRGDHRGPPPEAYKACEGKSAQFVGPRGQNIQGLCQEDETGKLVLRPDRRGEDQQGRQARERAGDRPSRTATASHSQDRPIPRIKKPYFATLNTPSGEWRTAIMGNDRITMMIGMNLAGYREDAWRTRRAFLSIVPFALLLLAGGGWVIAQRALKPVALITRTAESITARALDQRIPLSNADSELARLVEVINGMLDRLEKSFGQAVRFSADAAHELQTPLTILQGELDDAVQHAATGSDEQLRYSGLLEEVQRLKAIVQKLLILARADAGRLNLQLTEMNLSAVIGSAAEDAGVLAPQLKINTQVTPNVIVKADADLMQQVVGNLMSNAVKYNQENGSIRFQLTTRANKAYFTIANTGAPIPAKDREKIFDRFYRVDQSRNKAVSGSGLGLSLAREIVHAHHGELKLDPASGSEVSFTLSLPCSSAS